MDVGATNYLDRVHLFIFSNTDGKVRADEPEKVFTGFTAAFEALGWLSNNEPNAEELTKVTGTFRRNFQNIGIVSNPELNERVQLIRELAQAIIIQAKQCANMPEWKVTKRTHFYDAASRLGGAAETAASAVGCVVFAPLFWAGFALECVPHGNSGPKINPLMLPGGASMLGIADGYNRMTKTAPGTYVEITERIQEIAKLAEPFKEAELATEKK